MILLQSSMILLQPAPRNEKVTFPEDHLATDVTNYTESARARSGGSQLTYREMNEK